MWGSYCNLAMTWASKGKKAVEKESREAALVVKVMSLLSTCCRSPSKPLILFVFPGTKPYYFRARVHCLTCSCCWFIDFSLNAVSCSDSFSLRSVETRGKLIGHSPLPHSLPMIHLVYSPKLCISSFSLSLGTAVISRKNENNLYDFLFFGGRGWRDKQGVFWAMWKWPVPKAHFKIDATCKTFIRKLFHFNKLYVTIRVQTLACELALHLGDIVKSTRLFRRRTFYKSKLIHSLEFNYTKSSASESIRTPNPFFPSSPAGNFDFRTAFWVHSSSLNNLGRLYSS